jgi:hypothetical protein
LPLGLKDAMSDAELHVICARLDGGLCDRAARRELGLASPVGLDGDDEGRIVMFPDEQVRHAVERGFMLWRGLAWRAGRVELIAEASSCRAGRLRSAAAAGPRLPW